MENEEYRAPWLNLGNIKRAALEQLSRENDIRLPNLDGVSPEEVFTFLSDLDSTLKSKLDIEGEEHFDSVDRHITTALESITVNQIVGEGLGLDYSLELVSSETIVTEERFPNVLYCLIALPRKFSSEGLKRENHDGKGYHMHYVVRVRDKNERTNVLLTFNPKEKIPSTPPIVHTLYWEKHGGGLPRHPAKFGDKRRHAIFDTSVSMLTKVPKSEFKTPNRHAKVLLSS
ncbi:hypothetical protein [Pseudohalioglobus lutimaris]|nr:hypothetical protein [Pseudohalioglobus lutimaris]